MFHRSFRPFDLSLCLRGRISYSFRASLMMDVMMHLWPCNSSWFLQGSDFHSHLVNPLGVVSSILGVLDGGTGLELLTWNSLMLRMGGFSRVFMRLLPFG